MSQWIIQKIGVLSVAKTYAFIFAFFGLIIAFIYAMVFGIAFGAKLGTTFGIVIGATIIIVGPLIYGGMAFLAGLLFGWIYNFSASKIGGVEVELIEQPNTIFSQVPIKSTSPDNKPAVNT